MTTDEITTTTAPAMAPDMHDLLGFGADNTYAYPPELIRITDRKYLDFGATDEGELSHIRQQLSQIAADTGLGEHTYSVSPAPEIAPPKTTTKPPSRRKRGRPAKRGRKPAPKLRGRPRTMAGPLTAPQRRDILDAVDYAADIDRPLNCTVNIHPAKLDVPPSDIARWVTQGPWRSAGEWMMRRKDDEGRPVGWYGFVVRENYEGQDREHIHVLCHCRACDRKEFEAMLHRRHPGVDAVDVGDLDEDGVTYRLKQSSPNAMGPPRPGRPVAETHNRHDGSPVAAVSGRRYTLSRSLDLAARTHAGWQADRDAWRAERRDHFRAKAREDADAGLPSSWPAPSVIPVMEAHHA